VALWNAWQFDEAEPRRRAAESLAEVRRLVSESSLDSGEVAQAVSVQTLLGVGFARLLRLDPETGAVHTPLVVGEQPPAISVSGRAVLERRPLVTADLLADPAVALTDEFAATSSRRRSGSSARFRSWPGIGSLRPCRPGAEPGPCVR